MKLRSILCVSSIAIAASASALTTTNTFARLPVSSTDANMMLAIPLAGCGAPSAEIYVTNLVMTTGLSDNDKLLFSDGSKLYAWKIQSGAWVSYTVATKYAGTQMTPDGSTMALPCGKGCWLIRSSTTNPVYLYGQVNDGAVGVTVTGASSSGQMKYSIISRPYETGSINLASWNPGAAPGDTITVPDSTAAGKQMTYTWKDGAWKYQTSEQNGTDAFGFPKWDVTWVSASATIDAGIAFMYGRNSTTDLQINWTK